MHTESVYLSTKDAADEIGVGPDRFRQLEREGKIPAIRTHGGVRIFLRHDVLKLKARREMQKTKPKGGPDAA